MYGKCRTPGCGSYAINPHRHGRDPGVDLDLCDVCYWRTRAERLRAERDALAARWESMVAAREDVTVEALTTEQVRTALAEKE